MTSTDKIARRDYQENAISIDELNNAIETATKLLTHPYPSGSVRAANKMMEALILAGVTTAACGNLDEEHAKAFSIILQNPVALNMVARKVWYDEDIKELHKMRHMY
jgi:hypothetical protein